MQKVLIAIMLLCSIPSLYAMEGSVLKDEELVKVKDEPKNPESEELDSGPVIPIPVLLLNLYHFPSVHFSPGIKDPLTKLIQFTKGLRGVLYSSDLSMVMRELKERLKKGDSAIFVVNKQGQNRELRDTLSQHGGTLYEKDEERHRDTGWRTGKFQDMHSKYMIFDIAGKKFVLTGSYNPTDAGEKGWNNAVILDDPEVVQAYEEEFNAMLEYCKHITGPVYKEEKIKTEKEEEDERSPFARFPRAFFCPNLDDVLLKFIAEEQQGIQGAFFRFTLYNLAERMKGKLTQEHPVSVTMVVDSSNISQDFCLPLRLIAENGGEVYKGDDYKQMHHKFIVFAKNHGGKPLVWTGSFNATGQSCRDWENVVVLDDGKAIEKFLNEFDTIKRSSRKLRPDQLRIAKDNKGGKSFAKKLNCYPEEFV